MNRPLSVLVVDPQEETREVLRTALEQRGLVYHSARGVAQGLDLARRHRPDVIVLDVEATQPDAALNQEFADATQSQNSSLVVLGTIRQAAPPAGGAFVAKPYHYGALIQQIELVIAERRAA